MPDEPLDSQSPQDEPSEEELEARLRKLIEGIQPAEESPTNEESQPAFGEHKITYQAPDPEIDEQLDQKFQELGKKVGSVGRTELPEVPDWNYKRPKGLQPDTTDKSNYRGLGVGITVAYALVGFMGLGFLAGWAIDRSTGGQVWTALLGVLGTVIGMGVAFWMISRGGNR